MRRLKKIAAVVSLALVMGASATVLAGTTEAPGAPVLETTEPLVETINGTTEAPGFGEVILFIATLIV